MIIHFVDVGGIVDHRCLHFLFEIMHDKLAFHAVEGFIFYLPFL